MKNVENIFGSGTLYNIDEDLEGSIFCQCCACMSVSSDFLSWANCFNNINRIVKDPPMADNIIVLSCQVTDLAVLNDLKHLEELIDQYPDKNFFVGGCLAKRFDIPLPDNCKRLDNTKFDCQPIWDKSLISHTPPFWVKDFKEYDNEFSNGHLFRDMYPLRIGVGCEGKCIYCTIRETRGDFYEISIDNYTLGNEFYDNKSDIVLIADNPSADLLKNWIYYSEVFSKCISLRNVEPSTLIKIFPEIESLSKKKLLKILHSPIQSFNPDVLKDMNRPVDETSEFITKICPILKKNGVYLATNVIVDYKDFYYCDESNDVFDYVSWNPYWDGNWNIDKAKERWNHYFPWNKI